MQLQLACITLIFFFAIHTVFLSPFFMLGTFDHKTHHGSAGFPRSFFFFLLFPCILKVYFYFAAPADAREQNESVLREGFQKGAGE